jgi:predicted RNA-binding Zn ribbon-like protein
MDIRRSAPGDLALVEAFLRTRHEVTDVRGLERWQAAHGLSGDVSTEAFERAVRLREALRSLMHTNNGGPEDPAATAVVNAEIRACGLSPEVRPDGSVAHVARGPGRAGDATLGALLSAVVAAMTDGSWRRMKACAADDCRYAFYDHTRNRSGRWCDVAGCGANARMRAFRRRRGGLPA